MKIERTIIITRNDEKNYYPDGIPCVVEELEEGFKVKFHLLNRSYSSGIYFVAYTDINTSNKDYIENHIFREKGSLVTLGGIFFNCYKSKINDQEITLYYKDYIKSTLCYSEKDDNTCELLHVKDDFNPYIDIKFNKLFFNNTNFMDLDRNIDKFRSTNKEDYIRQPDRYCRIKTQNQNIRINIKYTYISGTLDAPRRGLSIIIKSIGNKEKLLTVEDLFNYKKAIEDFLFILTGFDIALESGGITNNNQTMYRTSEFSFKYKKIKKYEKNKSRMLQGSVLEIFSNYFYKYFMLVAKENKEVWYSYFDEFLFLVRKYKQEEFRYKYDLVGEAISVYILLEKIMKAKGKNASNIVVGTVNELLLSIEKNNEAWLGRNNFIKSKDDNYKTHIKFLVIATRHYGAHFYDLELNEILKNMNKIINIIYIYLLIKIIEVPHDKIQLFELFGSNISENNYRRILNIIYPDILEYFNIQKFHAIYGSDLITVFESILVDKFDEEVEVNIKYSYDDKFSTGGIFINQKKIASLTYNNYYDRENFDKTHKLTIKNILSEETKNRIKNFEPEVLFKNTNHRDNEEVLIRQNKELVKKIQELKDKIN